MLDREEYNPPWDGKPRWFSTTKAPFYDDQGQIIGLLGITRDITARKLTESENARLFETSLDLLGSSNGSHYVRLNPAWERTLGYTRDELYQMPYLALVHPDDLERTLANSIPLANGTPIMGFRNRLRAKDGGWRWIDWDVVPDLQMGLIHLTGRDVTSDKLLEDQFDIQHKALLESESRFRQMAETIEDCFWMYDPLADEMIYVSPSYERITGHPVSFLYDNPNAHLELIAPEDRERISRLWSTPTSVFDERYRILRPDGIVAWVWESTYVACNDEGAPYRVIGILRDITSDKLIEQRIHEQNEMLQATNQDLEIARSQAEEASRLKSRFLATMSHELRTPLNAIIGYTQLQQAGMAGPISKVQEEYLNRTLVNAEDLLRLINEVLDLSKIEAGRMELARKPFSPAQLLQEITSQHQVLAEAKSLNFSLTWEDTLPPTVIGDTGRVKQIIVNVIANAIKFTERGFVRVQSHWDENCWQVIVQDSGIGIPPEMQQTIFDEFRQVDGGLTRPYGGSGLGLSIVKKLIRLMNGNIQVSSRVGQGSTFTLCLPLPVPQESLSLNP
jgi:PAS domain S-box-containing protein